MSRRCPDGLWPAAPLQGEKNTGKVPLLSKNRHMTETKRSCDSNPRSQKYMRKPTTGTGVSNSPQAWVVAQSAGWPWQSGGLGKVEVKTRSMAHALEALFPERQQAGGEPPSSPTEHLGPARCRLPSRPSLDKTHRSVAGHPPPTAPIPKQASPRPYLAFTLHPWRSGLPQSPPRSALSRATSVTDLPTKLVLVCSTQPKRHKGRVLASCLAYSGHANHVPDGGDVEQPSQEPHPVSPAPGRGWHASLQRGSLPNGVASCSAREPPSLPVHLDSPPPPAQLCPPFLCCQPVRPPTFSPTPTNSSPRPINTQGELLKTRLGGSPLSSQASASFSRSEHLGWEDWAGSCPVAHPQRRLTRPSSSQVSFPICLLQVGPCKCPPLEKSVYRGAHRAKAAGSAWEKPTGPAALPAQ